MASKTITCRDCGESFEFTDSDQEFFKKNGWNDPFRCKPCRAKAKQDRPKQDQQRG